MMPLYTYVATAIVAGAIAATGTWQVQNWRYGTQLSKLKQEHSEAVMTAAKNALKLTEHYQEKANAALRQSEIRAAQNKRDADALRAELDGLRGDIANVPDRIRSASREAVDQYAATATAVFGECAARYSELAVSATGHASDVQTLMDAWPTNDNQAPPAK